MGRKDGVRPGLTVEVFRQGREIKHPRTGAVLGRAEQTLGTRQDRRRAGEPSRRPTRAGRGGPLRRPLPRLLRADPAHAAAARRQRPREPRRGGHQRAGRAPQRVGALPGDAGRRDQRLPSPAEGIEPEAVLDGQGRRPGRRSASRSSISSPCTSGASRRARTWRCGSSRSRARTRRVHGVLRAALRPRRGQPGCSSSPSGNRPDPQRRSSARSWPGSWAAISSPARTRAVSRRSPFARSPASRSRCSPWTWRSTPWTRCRAWW